MPELFRRSPASGSTLSRRALIGGGVAASALVAATMLPAGPAVAAPAARRRPLPVSSFGPNGTHYPSALPWLGDRAPVEVEADCSWAAIAAAVNRLTADQVTRGAVIRVRPGRLVGQGDSSSSPPVLSQVGRDSWTRNVLVCPRDGYGTVTVVDKGIRLDRCSRISLFGFSGETVGVVFTQCTDIQLGWGKWSSLNITRGARSVWLYEVVLGFRRNEMDTAGIRPTDENLMHAIYRYGCAFGPSVKPAGSSAHCDTLQVEGTGTGTFGTFLSVDCVDFGSSNAAILLHTRLRIAKFSHCMVLADRLPWTVFALRSGDYQGRPNAFTGGAQDVRLYDSIVCGPITALGYTDVYNTRLSYTPQASQRARRSGDWIVDPTIASWTAQDIYSRTGTDFANTSLARFWVW